MRLLGLEGGADRNASAAIGFQAGRGQVQLLHVALAADGIEQRVAGDFLLAHQVGDHAGGRIFHAIHFFVEAHGDAVIAQMVGKRLDDFGVGELQQARPFFHQDDAHSKGGEHAGVFHADHAAAHHN